MRYLTLFAWLWLAAPLLATDPPAPKPAPAIRFPALPEPTPAPSPSPTPKPDPAAPVKLAADTLYVVDADVDLMAGAFPEGLLKISKDVGPVKIHGRFVDGSGKMETRTYKGKCVLTIEVPTEMPVNGLATLVIVPVGAATEKDWLTKLIDANNGAQPPPLPPPPVPPGPTPGPVPIPVDGNRVLIVEESADRAGLPAAQLDVLFNKSVRNYLNAKCAMGPDGKTKEWRIWDKDAPTDAEAKVWQDAMKRPRTQTPWVVISTGKAGFEGPLPATVAGTLDLLKKYFGE